MTERTKEEMKKAVNEFFENHGKRHKVNAAKVVAEMEEIFKLDKLIQEGNPLVAKDAVEIRTYNLLVELLG